MGIAQANIAHGALETILALVRDGRSIDESVDGYIDSSDTRVKLAILETFGDRDLSDPRPDLTDGWGRVLGQLAYNALFSAASEQLATTARSSEP